jgi:penicillin amidase
MNWVAHHVEGNNLRLYALMTEPSLDGALKIASHAGMAHMNILVADTHGNAAWTIAGRIPRRTGFAGTEPVEWGNGVGWSGWLDTPEYPLLTTADHDYLWTANNRILDGDMLKKIGEGSSFALGVRARRIQQLLASTKTVNEAEMHNMQLDDVALLMKRWHGLITQIVAGMPDSEDKKILANTLAQWNGRATADSAAYRVIRRFRDEVAGDLMTEALAKVLKSDPKLRWDMLAHNWELPLWQIVSKRPANMLPVGFASWDAYLQDALVRRVYEPYKKRFNGALSKAVWGEANMSEIRHPLSKGIPLLGSILDMPSGPMNGDSNVVLAQLMSFGPAMRLVVSPGHEQDGILTMPAGQAGNPLTPYFGKGHAEWRNGKAVPLLAGTPRYVLRLSPLNNRP